MRFYFKDTEYICIAKAHTLNGGEYLVSVDVEDGKLILIPADSDNIIPVYAHD